MAVVNGALRDLAYGKLMGEKLAHSLSVVPLIGAILAWGWLLASWAPLRSKRAGLRVGLFWLLLTLAFEFGLGALRGLPLREMLAQYDITQGHLWPLVPLTMGWHRSSPVDWQSAVSVPQRPARSGKAWHGRCCSSGHDHHARGCVRAKG